MCRRNCREKMDPTRLARVRQAGLDDGAAVERSGVADSECWTTWSAGELLRNICYWVGWTGHSCFGFSDGWRAVERFSYCRHALPRCVVGHRCCRDFVIS
jgi:hypothetical protein